MTSAELNHLESQVDHLMRVIDNLQLENATLRQKVAVHIREHSRLQHMHDRVVKQVKHVIKQMKEKFA